MQLFRHCTPFKLSNTQVSTLHLDTRLPIQFQLVTLKTPMVQLPDPNKPYLLFMDTSKICFSGVLIQASNDKSQKALIKLLTDKDPLKSVHSQRQELQLNSVVHPVAYISDSFTESQCRWPAITKECFGVLY